MIAGLCVTSPDKLTLNLYYNVKSLQTRRGRKLFTERRALEKRMKRRDGGDDHTMTVEEDEGNEEEERAGEGKHGKNLIK